MYPASAAFHEAVKQNKPQVPLLIFSDAIFTEEDIDVDTGIGFDDYFNLEDDIAIGQTPSNEIRFTLFNDKRTLNNYAFGEFTATIGVLVGEENYQQTGPVVLITQYAQYVGSDSYPYLRRNGALVAQPSFAVKSLLAYDGYVWAFSGDGRYAAYDDATGANATATAPTSAYIQEKAREWIGRSYYYNRDSRILFVYEGGKRKRYECVPLGVFIADRPNVPDQIRIDMTCHDRMMNFEKDMPSAEELGITYPTTVGNIYVRICENAGVPYETASFINSDLAVEEEPEAFKTATMRTVLSWIAEVAASNAKFDRNGVLKLDWFRSTSQSYSEGDYTDFQPYWYETQKIDKLYNRSTASGVDDIVGSGSGGYLIQDNPFLPVSEEAEDSEGNKA